MENQQLPEIYSGLDNTNLHLMNLKADYSFRSNLMSHIDTRNGKMFIPYYAQPDYKERIKTLNEKERSLLNDMLPQYGVPYFTGQPGVGKSASSKSLAMKMNWNFIDVRLAQADETDFQFPNIEYSERFDLSIIGIAIPEWAILSNDAPCIIHFEELNRAPLQVKNAALQILLERSIGSKFHFNKNVFMMSSGNLGDEDGTEVNENDAALNNRLIHRKYTLTPKEWLNWANENETIHPDILSFIDMNPQYLTLALGDSSTEELTAYQTPRSWEMVSKYISTVYGGGVKNVPGSEELIVGFDGKPVHFPGGYKVDENNKIVYEKNKNGVNVPVINWGDESEYARDIMSFCTPRIGSDAANKFFAFISNRKKVTLKDVITDWNKSKKILETFDHSKKNEIISQANEYKVGNFSKKETKNYISFLETCRPETRAGALVEYLDDDSHRVVSEGNESGRGDDSVDDILEYFIEDVNNIGSHTN